MPPILIRPIAGTRLRASLQKIGRTGLLVLMSSLAMALSTHAQTVFPTVEHEPSMFALAGDAGPLMLEDEAADAALPAPDTKSAPDPLEAQVKALSKRLDEIEKAQKAKSEAKPKEDAAKGDAKKEEKKDDKKSDKPKVSEWADMSDDKWTSSSVAISRWTTSTGLTSIPISPTRWPSTNSTIDVCVLSQMARLWHV